MSPKPADPHQDELEELRHALIRVKAERDAAYDVLRQNGHAVPDLVALEPGVESPACPVFFSLLTHLPAGVAYLDRQLVYRWLNPAYAQLIGQPITEVLGRSIFEVAPALKAPLGPLLERALQSGEPHIGAEIAFEPPENGAAGEAGERQLVLEISCVPLRGESQQVEGLLLLDVDVTARAEQEVLHRRELRDLQELDRYKDEFLSVISHELRTPLTFILGFASLLEDEAAGTLNDKQHEFVTKILTGVDRMLNLVNDLLDVAKFKSGKLDLVPAPLPYADLLQEAADLTEPIAEEKGIRFRYEPDLPPGLMLNLDGIRTLQVLHNLLSNALKFTCAGGTIRLTAFVHDDEVITQVSDTGVGIPAEAIPHLFQRFQQLDMSRTRQVSGTGLGLSIAKALVEAQGGRIGVISEHGKGSTFWFSFPLHTPDATP